VNELITERIPYFNQVSTLEELITKVTTGEGKDNRPLLGDQAPARMKEFITKCWALDPKKRPTFATMLQDESWKFGNEPTTVMDDIKEKVIKHFESNNGLVKFGPFVRLLAKILDETKNLFVEHEIKGPFNKPMVLMLLAAIGLGKCTDEVKWDNIEHLFIWVGDKAKKSEFLEITYSLMNMDWFFGVHKNQQDIERLFSQAKTGNYCVIWDLIHKKFVLSYMKTDIVTVSLKEQRTVEDLKNYMKTVPPDLKDPLPQDNKPECYKNLKMKEAFATSASNYSFNTEVKQHHFLYVN